jgi:hypothetical protein
MSKAGARVLFDSKSLQLASNGLQHCGEVGREVGNHLRGAGRARTSSRASTVTFGLPDFCCAAMLIVLAWTPRAKFLF